MDRTTNHTLNILLGVSIALKIGISLWQLHRMYRLEMAEKRLAEERGEEALIMVT